MRAVNRYYLLWAFGGDKSGIVAGVTKFLFQHGCNLEDSSMMRLGSEFGMFVIFTRKTPFTDVGSVSAKLARALGLSVGLKPISRRDAKFVPPRQKAYTIVVHGVDKPGIVFRVTSRLAKNCFNITDLATHRTTSGRRAGYVLFIEGELPSLSRERAFRRDLSNLRRSLGVRIEINEANSLPV